MAVLRVWVAPLFSIVAITSCTKQHPHTQTAVEIVAAMAATYEHATSYMDSGEVKTVYTGSVPHIVRAPFETTFVRSEGFRFEFRNGYDPRPAVIWTSEGKIHRYWTTGPVEDETSLASATFHSSIPRLLLHSLDPGPSLADLKQLRIDGDELIDEHLCWRVVGVGTGGDQLTLWIDKATYLLRQTSRRRHFPSAIEVDAFDAETVTLYRPVLNEHIDSTQLSGPDPTSIKPPRTDPWLGVQLHGVRVVRVVGGSPADGALQVSDELVSVDGIPITDARALITHVGRKTVGATVVLVVRRAGIERSSTIALADRWAFAEQQRQLLDKPAPPFSTTLAHDDGKIADAYHVMDASTLTVIDRKGVARFTQSWTSGLEVTVQELLEHDQISRDKR